MLFDSFKKFIMNEIPENLQKYLLLIIARLTVYTEEFNH